MIKSNMVKILKENEENSKTYKETRVYRYDYGYKGFENLNENKKRSKKWLKQKENLNRMKFKIYKY